MSEGKKRHGCLTAWLILMIIANSLAALMYLFGTEMVRRALPNLPGWTFPVLVVFSLFNVVCAVFLFQWKKWAFYGFCLSAAVALVVNMTVGLGILRSLLGLIGVLLLYAVLQIGKENKGWPQLD